MMSVNAYLTAIISIVLVLVLTGPSYAMGPVVVDDSGKAIRGYDLVTYFQGQAVQGKPAIAYRWQGVCSDVGSP